MGGEKKRIAVVMDSFESEHNLKYCEGIKAYFEQSQDEVVFFQCGVLGSTEKSYEYQNLAVTSLINSLKFDGLIFIADCQLQYFSTEQLYSFLKSFDPLPVVCLGYPFPDFGSVISSSKKGYSDLLDNLIVNKECRKFLIVELEDNSYEQYERRNCIINVLKKHDIKDYDICHVQKVFVHLKANTCIKAYDESNDISQFDAIIALNDDLAKCIIDYVNSKGLVVPEDIIVTGYDDIPQSCLTNPTITTINHDMEKQGYEAAVSVCDIVGHVASATCKTVTSYVVFRQSTGDVPLWDKSGNGINIERKEVLPKIGNVENAVAQWYTKRTQFDRLIKLFNNMQDELNLEELRKNLSNYMQSFDIKAAAICLFEQPVLTDRFEYFPLPSQAYLYDAFDLNCGYQYTDYKNKMSFNPRISMLPENIPLNIDGMYITSLYNNSVIYGYVMFRFGEHDMVIYSLICKMLSSNIAQSHLLTAKEAEREDLKRKYTMANLVSVTDELTGLLNRRGFMDIGQNNLDLLSKTSQKGMVLYIDIDGLKKINDTYGHAAGDRAIQVEAEILQRCFRKNDIIGRLGGDEFGIVAPNLTEASLEKIKSKIEKSCQFFNKRNTGSFMLSMSIGNVSFGEEDDSKELYALMNKADSVLYSEKTKKHKIIEN